MQNDSDELRETYLSWTLESLDSLEGLLANLQSGVGDPATLVEEMHGITHNIKGMGTSFGYPLMTECAGLVSTYFRHLIAEGMPPTASIVEAHCKAMRTIIENNIEGDGGEMGAALLTKLGSLTQSPQPA